MKKVYVGLSGGVDSAVSAALLKKEGYDVTGVFIKAWTPPWMTLVPRSGSGVGCTWKEDRRSAMRVAAILDIPFITLDLEKEYKKEVVDYMVAEYKIGRTPNPDVMCNKEIKFGHFLKFALKNGADFVATGHYAQRNELRSMNYELCEGKDKNKDQSYFLWTLTQSQLKHILFPIGHLQKLEVRRLAEKFGLPQATRKDSQGLCFLGKVDMKEFLSRYIIPKRGDVLNGSTSSPRVKKGEVIGYHNGALFFTIGERHGFIITKKSDREVPLYVVAKDIEKNTLTVAPKNSKNQQESSVEKVWLSLQERPEDFLKRIFPAGSGSDKKLSCRIRYRQEKIKCKIGKEKEGIKVIFDRPQMGVSAGQSLVLYNGEVCLGGGIISQ